MSELGVQGYSLSLVAGISYSYHREVGSSTVSGRGACDCDGSLKGIFFILGSVCAICVFVCMQCVSVSIWRPEVNVLCLLQSLSFVKQKTLKLTDTAWLVGQDAPWTCLSPPVLGLQLCTAMPSFYCGRSRLKLGCSYLHCSHSLGLSHLPNPGQEDLDGKGLN